MTLTGTCTCTAPIRMVGSTRRLPSYGQCSLTTNPSVALFFSDRSKGNQPFSIDQMEQLVVSLDTVNNRIVSKSITSNNESVYTNVSRMGNFIYAESPGSLLIINLHKWTGKMSEHYRDRP